MRLEEPDQAVPEEGVVLGEDDAHGTSSVTRVGPPIGLDTLIVPSKAASRRVDPPHPGARPRVGAAPPVVADDHAEQSPARVASSTQACRGVRVLADVGQALGDGEVDRGLDRRRQPAGERRR